uniref:Uncharacterized protein n=1 Tax=Lygus hesperus TaxID=30085 RepID=A0A146LTU6_LYGHE
MSCLGGACKCRHGRQPSIRISKAGLTSYEAGRCEDKHVRKPRNSELCGVCGGSERNKCKKKKDPCKKKKNPCKTRQKKKKDPCKKKRKDPCRKRKKPSCKREPKRPRGCEKDPNRDDLVERDQLVAPRSLILSSSEEGSSGAESDKGNSEETKKKDGANEVTIKINMKEDFLKKFLNRT